MHCAVLLLAGLLAADVPDYSRSLGAKKLDQATLDAEGFGEKKAFKREDGGLRITLGPGEAETGWKAPQALRIGGDFTITANIVIRKLPKPAQEDGAAVGLAIATQNIDQPDATLVRLIEMDGSDVYRSIDAAKNVPQQPQQFFNPGMMQPDGKPPKPPRRTSPAKGEVVRFEIRREGQTVQYQVVDAESARPRYLGQVTLGANDVMGLKLFASNRNGAEAVDVLFCDLTIRAARITGLGTEVRTVFGEVIHGEPTAIEEGKLIVGGPTKTPPQAAPAGPAAGPGAATPNVATPAATPGPAGALPPAPAPAAPPQATVAAAPAAPNGAVAKPDAPAPANAAPAPATPAPGAAPPTPVTAKARVPLDEVESIAFERSPTLAGRFQGQPNVDLTMARADEAKKDAAKEASGKKDADNKDASKKDTVKEDSGKKDAGKEESAKEHAVKEDSVKEDSVKKDAPKDDSTKKDAAKDDSSKKDAAKDDSVKKDEATKDSTKVDAAKKDAPKDDSTKKDASRDDSSKKDASKDDSTKKDASKDDSSKKDAAKDDSTKKDTVKDDSAKKDAARKDSAKDDSAKKDSKADDVLAPPPGTVAPTKIPKVEAKPNGIRDLHLALSGLRSAEVKQVTVNCQTDAGAAAWRLDTTDSRDWPLVIRRAGTESWADLFLEPPAGDVNQKDFTVNVTYADGQGGNATIKATEHTDPKLAFDPNAPPPSFDARVYLTGEEQLFGKLEALGEETLRLRTPWGDRLDVPLSRVVAVYMGLPEHKESPESFARRLKVRGTEDLLLARTKDGEVVAIPGVAEGTEGDKLLFRLHEKTRTLPLKQVEGLVLAARPEPKRPDELRPTFSLAGGLVVSGLWKTLDDKTWKLETAWGQDLNLPAADIQNVRFRGGQMTYLSDLDPSRVEEIPFFGRRSHWRRDVNLVGEPLKMDGRTYGHGLAVHSRSILTYELDGRYATFEALVGFDDSAKGKGRVECKVLADGKELYANPDLRANAPPAGLALAVAGVGRLQLVVDFGQDEDTGDSVIWANARLYRRSPPRPQTEAPADAAQPKSAEPKRTPTPGSGQ